MKNLMLVLSMLLMLAGCGIDTHLAPYTVTYEVKSDGARYQVMYNYEDFPEYAVTTQSTDFTESFTAFDGCSRYHISIQNLSAGSTTASIYIGGTLKDSATITGAETSTNIYSGMAAPHECDGD